MKVFYYYLRDEEAKPFGCVCIGYDNDCKFSRGISLCSSEDQFNKKVARKISRGRCMRAIGTKSSNFKIKYPSVKIYDGIGLIGIRDSVLDLFECTDLIPPPFLFTHKSEYNVNITPYEKEIVKDEI